MCDMFMTAMDGSDGNHQGRKTLPETWGMERERKEWIPCL